MMDHDLAKLHAELAMAKSEVARLEKKIAGMPNRSQELVDQIDEALRGKPYRKVGDREVEYRISLPRKFTESEMETAAEHYKLLGFDTSSFVDYDNHYQILSILINY